jgi:hypothetical protein
MYQLVRSTPPQFSPASSRSASPPPRLSRMEIFL